MAEYCGCMPFPNYIPIARLSASYGGIGNVVVVDSQTSEWNETPTAATANRQIRWYIFKNGFVVWASVWVKPQHPVVFLSVSTTPSVSTGQILYFDNAETNVKAYLAQQQILIRENDVLEMAIHIFNGDFKQSELSNRIVLGGGKQADCCDDSDIYELRINNSLFCFASQSGDCYTPH